MAGRSWDDPWQSYPASKPRKAVGGIATSKQRGQMASQWWSRRVVEVLDSYGLGARMQRGRRYARQGQVLSLDVQPGLVVAQVQGSRRNPYVVTVTFAPPTDLQWTKVLETMAERVAFAAQLLAGEVPGELEQVFDAAGVALLPGRWSAIKARCSCPDPENPCKHIAAVLYVFADRLDDDPWLLLAWRGRQRDDIMAALGPRRGATAQIAPWWPLTPGAPTPTGASADSWAVDDTFASLARLGPLDVKVKDQPITSILRLAYEAIADQRRDG